MDRMYIKLLIEAIKEKQKDKTPKPGPPPFGDKPVPGLPRVNRYPGIPPPPYDNE